MEPSAIPVAPSGRQVPIASGDQRAVVVEVGGALRSYVASGHQLLDGYGADEMASAARGQPLIPWPNRLRDGLYAFDGQEHQLPLTEPDKDNAIHGLVRWANWTVAEQAEDRVAMEHRLHPQAGWPFALDLRIEYTLAGEGLTVRTSATNVGGGRCPYGAGAHPYLKLGTETIDPLILQAPGRRHLPTDDRGIPTGVEPVERHLARLPRAARTRRYRARHRLHRSPTRRGRPGPRPPRHAGRRAPRHALARSRRSVPDAVHRRLAPRGRAPASRAGDRGDDLCAQRPGIRGRAARARAR